MSFFSYLFNIFPPALDYGSVQLMPFLVLSLGLILASILLSRWRKKTSNVVTKKLSKTWPTAAFAFGFVGFILVLSRAENIQYISMRFWWVVWFVLGLLFVYLQYRVYKARHYEILPSQSSVDPREKYLPKRKK